MGWFTKEPRRKPTDVRVAEEALADADMRLQRARETRSVSAAVKLSLQELRASDYFTASIFPREER